jgi:uncharacterized protein (TIGR01777 family)
MVMKNILIAGGSGLIGTKIAATLLAEGHHVSLLSRNNSNKNTYKTWYWDPLNGIIDEQVLKNQDIIINLAGSGIARWPWTRKRKRTIYDSRILSTRLLVDTILNQKLNPSQFISVSATGYYGNRPDEKISEMSGAGTGFLSFVCKAWENEALRLKDKGIPVSILRTGIVLSKSGGSFPVLVKPLKFGGNVLFKKGLHFIPWIHIDDLVKIFSEIINDSLLPGLYNTVAPHPVSQQKFNEAINSVLGRKTITIKVPEKLLAVFFGEMRSIVTDDQNINPAHLIGQDFNFQFPEINSAIKNLLK